MKFHPYKKGGGEAEKVLAMLEEGGGHKKFGCSFRGWVGDGGAQNVSVGSVA